MADRVLTESHTLYTCYNLLQMVYDHSRQGSIQITNLEGEKSAFRRGSESRDPCKLKTCGSKLTSCCMEKCWYRGGEGVCVGCGGGGGGMDATLYKERNKSVFQPHSPPPDPFITPTL